MIKDLSWLKTSLIAHRGYHNHHKGIPENSLASCKKALVHGYGIEIDVSLTSDDHVILFHDDDLLRMTGQMGHVCDFKYEDIKSFTLLDSNEAIPKLDEALTLIDGNVPLLIELKPTKKYQVLAKKTYELIKNYNGKVAIFSFHPGIVKWYKQNAPHIIRGQISSYFKDYPMSVLKKLLMKRMVFNRFTKPDFISYHIQDLPNRYLDRLKKKGITIISYAAKSQEAFDRVKLYYDNVVFEGFEPK